MTTFKPAFMSSPNNRIEWTNDNADDSSAPYDDLSSNSLFRLIEDGRWKKARYTLLNSSLAVRQWVSKNENSGPIWRRLPIHEACVRQPPIEIISALLESYPDCVFQGDNAGRLPLHYAIIHNAHVDTIYLLLDSFYKAKNTMDLIGKTPRDYVPAHNLEIAAALTQSRKYISLTACQVKAKARASIAHFATSNSQLYSDNGSIFPPKFCFDDTVQTRSPEQKFIVRGEFVAKRVQAEIHGIAETPAVEAMLKARIRELEKKLLKKQEVIDNMQQEGCANKDFRHLLKQSKTKNRELQKTIDGKNIIISEILNSNSVRRKAHQKEIKEKDARIEWLELQAKNRKTAEESNPSIAPISSRCPCELEASEGTSVYESCQSDVPSERLQPKLQAYEKRNIFKEMLEVYSSTASDLNLGSMAKKDSSMIKKKNVAVDQPNVFARTSLRPQKDLSTDISLLSLYEVDKSQRTLIGNLDNGKSTHSKEESVSFCVSDHIYHLQK